MNADEAWKVQRVKQQHVRADSVADMHDSNQSRHRNKTSVRDINKSQQRRCCDAII